MFVKPHRRINAQRRRTAPLLLLGTCLLGAAILAGLSHSKHGVTTEPERLTVLSAPADPRLLLNQPGGRRVFLGGTVPANRVSARHSQFHAGAYYYDNVVAQVTSSVGISKPDTSGYLCDGAVGDTKTGYTHTLKVGGVLTMNVIVDVGPDYASIPIKYLQTTYRPAIGGYLSGSNDGLRWTNLTPWFNIGSDTTYQLYTPQSCRYYQFSQINGGGPGKSVTVTDFRLYDSTGAMIGPPSSTNDASASPRAVAAGAPATASALGP